MMREFISKDSFLREAKNAKHKPNVVLQILIFLVVFFVSQIAVGIIASIAAFIQAANILTSIDYTDSKAVYDVIITIMESRGVMLVSLFTTMITTILIIVYCTKIEGRSLKSMGFVKKNAGKQYLIGVLVGFIMFSVCVGICMITGTLKYNGIIIGGNVVFVILFFFGFLFQGMSEEVVLRGYFMTSLSNKVPIVVAIMISSVAFACLHLMNSGISILAFVNLIIFGIFASVYAIKTNNLWGICAIHSIWNFVQGNFFGILVSGQKTNASIFQFVPTQEGTLINGGDFGLEGGLAVTIVLVLATVIMLFININRKQPEEEILQDYA